MKKYMVLDRRYNVEYGKYDVTLLDFETGNYFSLCGEKNIVFRKWMKGCAIDTETLTGQEKELYDYFLSNNVADFSDKYYARESYNVGKKLMLYNEKRCKLCRMFIELADVRSSYEKRMTSSCWVCQSDEKINISDADKYVRLIEGAASYGCDQIILYGGNVIAAPEIKDLMKAADDSYIQLCILVNGRTLTDDEIKCSAENNTILVVTVDASEKFDYEYFSELHERISSAGGYAKYSIVVTNDTVKEYNLCAEKIAALGAEVVNVSMIIDDSISETELSEICTLESVNINEYKLFSSMNVCMAGTIAVDHNMNVIPCPLMKKYPLGRIVDDNGIRYEKNNVDYRLSDFWLSNKEYMKNCSDCSRKHLCMDCRAAEIEYSDNKYDRFYKRDCIYMKKCQSEYKEIV